MYRHKVPIHLDQPDHFIAGLTARQILIIGSGVSIGYMAFNDLSNIESIGLVLGIIVGVAVALLSVLVAFVRVKKRGLETWAMVLVLFYAQPKVWLWKPEEETIEPLTTKGNRAKQQEEEKEEW